MEKSPNNTPVEAQHMTDEQQAAAWLNLAGVKDKDVDDMAKESVENQGNSQIENSVEPDAGQKNKSSWDTLGDDVPFGPSKPEMARGSVEHIKAAANMVHDYAAMHNIEKTRDEYGWEKFEIDDPKVRGELIDFLAKNGKVEEENAGDLEVSREIYKLHNEIRGYVGTYGNLGDFIDSIKDSELNERQQEEAKKLVLDYVPPHSLATMYESGNLAERGITERDILEQETAIGMRKNLYAYESAGFRHRDILQKAGYSFLLFTSDAESSDAETMKKDIAYLRNSGFTGAEILSYSSASFTMLDRYFSNDDSNPIIRAQQKFLDENFTPTEILDAMEAYHYDENSIKKLAEKGVSANQIWDKALRTPIIGSSDKNTVIHKFTSPSDATFERIFEVCAENGLQISKRVLYESDDLLIGSVYGRNNILSMIMKEVVQQPPEERQVSVIEAIDMIADLTLEREMQGEEYNGLDVSVATKNEMRDKILTEWYRQVQENAKA